MNPVPEDHDPVAAPPWVARGGERAARLELDRGDAAEVKIPPPPACYLVAVLLEAIELLRVGAALAVHHRFVEMDARRDDRLVDGKAMVDHVDDGLEDRAAQPDGACAAGDEPGATAPED